MCGFVGAFFPRDAAIHDIGVDRLIGLLRHRGPDGTGRYVAEDRRYQAGFSRLAIIDLESAEQPILHHHGDRVLMGNGEIYNYLELRQDARVGNYPFRTDGDMEVILPLHDAAGRDFVDDLNGMFALALYDARDHSLLLVRDRLGVKPIYWTRLAGGGIAFASEIKALLAIDGAPHGIDEGAVSAYLAHGYVPAPATLFQGIAKLPPAHMLAADATGGISVQRYWRADRTKTTMPNDAETCADELAELLGDSVGLQLRSDVPVGALLSGGIDSSLVVALAAERSAQPVNTFTVRFENAPVDETPLARQVADRYKTNHTVIELPADAIGTYLPRLAWYCDEPIYDPSLLPNYLIERALGGHVKVALNGTGGDELFAGYGRYFRLPVERRYGHLPAWLRRNLIEPGVRTFSPMTAWQLRRAEKFCTDRGGYLHDHSTHFPPPIRAAIGNRQTVPPPAQATYYAEFGEPPETAALYADLNTYLPDDLLTILDRTSMAVSVEGRVPFLDHRLVEAALAVPPAIRTADGRAKALERRIAERYLPRDLIEAPKQGFAAPVPAWLETGTFAAAARRLLTSRQSLERGWWTEEGIDFLLSDVRRHGFRIYTLLMLELAIRVHLESPSIEAPNVGLEEFADAA